LSSIVIVVPELLPVPPVLGGAVEHWVDEVSWRLQSLGHKLAIVSRPACTNGHQSIDYIGIPWTPIEELFSRIKDKVTWKNPIRYVSKIQNVYSYGRRVAKAVQDFDIVYLHNEPNILLFLNKQPGQKVVLHMHNDHLSMKLFRPFYRHALAKADRVVCVSDYIRRQAVAVFPEYADRFCVVFNATDPDVFKPYGDEAIRQLDGIVPIDPDKQYLLYVGRLTPVKGVHVLIEAFKEVHRQLPDVRLIITGSSFFGGAAKTDYEQRLIDLAESVSEYIVFTGYLAHEKLKYLYSFADMLVFPSTWQEPFGLVMLESMSAGTCSVCSAVGGIPEVLETNVNGVLVQPDDANELARTICKTLRDPKSMRRMEDNARHKIVANYTWERLVGELEIVFGSLS
jgi:spore coat protein SA